METLLRAIDANDADTGAHVRRVARYALILADALDMNPHQRRSVERLALFHDIGKIHEALFDLIHDENDLSESERQQVKTHPQRGADVMAPLTAFYPDLADGILSHHERWDGTGYPRGLAGKEIPRIARVVAIADTFDAMTYRRRYSSERGADEAARTIAESAGKQFDPALVRVFLSDAVFSRVLRARREKPQATPRPKQPPVEATTAGASRPVPDVTFRWRTLTIADPPARPRGRRRSRRPDRSDETPSPDAGA
jgi:putative two-component system response regulator